MDDKKVMDKFFYLLAVDIVDDLIAEGKVKGDNHTELVGIVLTTLGKQREKIKKKALDND